MSPTRPTAQHEPERERAQRPGAEEELAQQGASHPATPLPHQPSAAALHQMQRNRGNQAVMRYLQRDGGSSALPPVPNYQLTPPTLQAPGWRRPSLLGDGPQLRLDPQIEAELRAMQIRAALAPSVIRPQLAQLPIGPIRLPPPGPAGQPATTPPAPQPQPAGPPQPRVGEQGEPPREGTAGDVLKAITERPEVEAALGRLGDHALMQWQQLRLGGQVAFVSTSALIAGGVIAGIASSPEAQRFVFGQLSGTVLPVPGMTWLRAEFNVADNNLMFGLHLDVGRFLPQLGFGSGSSEAMGGPPQLEDAPGPPTLRRSTEHDQ